MFIYQIDIVIVYLKNLLGINQLLIFIILLFRI